MGSRRAGWQTTKVMTENGAVYDLGKHGHPPSHPECRTACAACLVVNAWTEPADGWDLRSLIAAAKSE